MTPLPVEGARQDSTDVALERATTSVNRLLATIFLILLVLAATGLGLRYWEAVRDSRRNAENLAHLLSEYLVVRLGAVDGVLFRVTAGSRRIGGPVASEREWSTLLRTAVSGVAGLSSVIITDAEGVVTHATIPQIVGMSWGDRAIFKELAAGHSNLLAVDVPFGMAAGDQVLVPFGRALTDAQGAFMGAVLVTLVPNQLQDFYQSFDLGQSGVITVLLPSGEVLFREDVSGGLGDAMKITLPPMERTASSAALVRGPLVPGGPEYLTAYRRSEIADLTIAVSLAESDFASTWRYEAIAAVALVVISGLLLLAARRRINDAVLDAVEAARADNDMPEGL